LYTIQDKRWISSTLQLINQKENPKRDFKQEWLNWLYGCKSRMHSDDIVGMKKNPNIKT